NVALAYFNLRDVDQTVRMLEPVIGQFDALIGPHYDRTIKARNLLAQAYALRGDLDKAIDVANANIAALERHPPADPEDLVVSRLTEAKFALYAHRLDVAESLAVPGVAFLAQKYPGPNFLKTRARWILGETLVQSRRCNEARPVLETALAETRAQSHDTPNTNVAEILDSLGRCRVLQGDYRGARDLFVQALDIDRKALGPSKASTLRSEIHLAWVDVLISPDRSTLDALTRKREALVTALGSEHHPVVWQYDLLIDSLADELHVPRADSEQRKSAEGGLERLAGSATVPRFVGLNSLS
ncbi:MAG TPA: tetratricopeptide repeat protein, partial [Sphingomicrobium sp.]|nr:tetratricopeptide repeat protein [Sphingomicrobium sp.]